MFKSKLAWLAYGNISIKIFGFLVFATISKTLPQAEYAKYAYYLLIIGAALELVNSGLFQGIQNEVSRNLSNVKYLKLLIGTSVGLGFLVSTFSALFVILYISIADPNANVNGLSLALYIGVSCYIVFSTAYSLMNIIFIGIKDSKQYFCSVIIQGIFSFASILLLLVNGFGSPDNILACIGVSYFTGVLFQLKRIRPNFLINSTVIKKLFSRGKWYALWSFTSIIESRIDLYFLSILSTSKEFAIFDVSTKYLVIGQILTSTLAQKFLPEILDSSCEEDKKKQFTVLNRTTQKLVLVNNILSIPVALFIFVFYSGEYNESIYCFFILTLAMIFNIRNMNNTAKIISDGEEYLLFIVMCIVVLIKFPMAWFLIAKFNEIGASISVVLAQAISFVLFAYFTKKLNRKKI